MLVETHQDPIPDHKKFARFNHNYFIILPSLSWAIHILVLIGRLIRHIIPLVATLEEVTLIIMSQMQSIQNTIASLLGSEKLKYHKNYFCLNYLDELVHAVFLRHCVYWKDGLCLVDLEKLTVETKRFLWPFTECSQVRQPWAGPGQGLLGYYWW